MDLLTDEEEIINIMEASAESEVFENILTQNEGLIQMIQYLWKDYVISLSTHHLE